MSGFLGQFGLRPRPHASSTLCIFTKFGSGIRHATVNRREVEGDVKVTSSVDIEVEKLKENTIVLISRLKRTAFAKLAKVTPRAACPSKQTDSTRGSLPAGRGPAAIFSFVPAHSGSRAAAVAGQISRLQRGALGTPVLLAKFDPCGCSSQVARASDALAWDAIVSEVDGVDVLAANEVQPDQLQPVIEYARENYLVVCADLTSARESHAVEVLRASDGIFLVADSDSKSLEAARNKFALLRSLDLAERAGLLLARHPNGAGPVEAEDITGVPVCSLIDTEKQLEQLAAWLICGINCEPDRESREQRSKVRRYAIAV